MILIRDWHRVFAIRPVTTLGGRGVWGRWVERRIWEGPGGEWPEYRMPLYKTPAQRLGYGWGEIA